MLCIAPTVYCYVSLYLRYISMYPICIQICSSSPKPCPSMQCCWPQQTFSNQVFAKVSICLFEFLPQTTYNCPWSTAHCCSPFRKPQPPRCPLALSSLHHWKFPSSLLECLPISKWLEGAEKGKTKHMNQSASDFFLSSFCDATNKLLCQ